MKKAPLNKHVDRVLPSLTQNYRIVAIICCFKLMTISGISKCAHILKLERKKKKKTKFHTEMKWILMDFNRKLFISTKASIHQVFCIAMSFTNTPQTKNTTTMAVIQMKWIWWYAQYLISIYSSNYHLVILTAVFIYQCEACGNKLLYAVFPLNKQTNYF